MNIHLIFVLLIILPSLIIISSTNTFYYSFQESISLGIPSVGFIDSDLEFFDTFYPILGIMIINQLIFLF